jgi:hypothetical protein
MRIDVHTTDICVVGGVCGVRYKIDLFHKSEFYVSVKAAGR